MKEVIGCNLEEMRFKQLGASALGQIPTSDPIGGQCKRTVAPERAHTPRARRHLERIVCSVRARDRMYQVGTGLVPTGRQRYRPCGSLHIR